MTTSDKIEIMQAFLNGKPVEYAHKYSNDWKPVRFEPLWDFSSLDYRIVPDIKYRPYNSAAEFLKDSKEHGPYLRKIKWGDSYKLPTFIGFDFISINKLLYSDKILPWKFKYSDIDPNEWEWQDGTPLGVKE